MKDILSKLTISALACVLVLLLALLGASIVWLGVLLLPLAPFVALAYFMIRSDK